MPRLCCLLLSLLIAPSASAVTIDWTFIGDPGNACDPQGPEGCFGGVLYAYRIGTYEVTNAQYAEFLNAKASSDPVALYNASMGSGFGGITRTGSPGSYNYSAIAGREEMPVNFVLFYDAVRFANWMNNGQGTGDTETGAYTITAQGIADNSITRNAGATILLPTEDEWYKAAYYDGISARESSRRGTRAADALVPLEDVSALVERAVGTRGTRVAADGGEDKSNDRTGCRYCVFVLNIVLIDSARVSP